MRVMPPVVAVGSLVVAVAAQLALPGWRFAFPGQPVMGAALLVLGGVLAAAARQLFTRRGTTADPFGTASSLVVSGPYRLTRNPMYLGMFLMLAGVAVFFGGVALLLAPVVFFLMMSARQVPLEEARLRARFGTEYDAYRRRVRRWL